VTGSLARDDRRAAQIRGLTELSRALTYAVSFDEVLQLTVERAGGLLDAQATVLMLANEDGVMTTRASVGCLAPEAAREHTATDSVVEQLQLALGVTAERCLGVPLVVGGNVMGILAVALPEHRSSTDDDQEWLLSALADQAAVALEKSRLDERGRFRDRLIGIVSHDLRNPISTILLGTSVLLDDVGLAPHTVKTLTRIQSSAERAGRLISDILDYTQAHLGGGIRVERKPNDLGPIFRQAIDEIEISHPEHEFELVLSGDTRAELDPDRIAQVLGNLLSNAVHYSPPDTRVRIELHGQESSVAFAVHNRGSVIPPDRIRDIFEPMQQITPGAGRGHRSVGLGLYIVESIVNSHRGTLGVTSTAADGTTFSVTIPRVAAPG
jgi:sigma-B regulation protein RsbU (phosphoserine phosphatase)